MLDIFADVLRYLFAAVKLYITETMPYGASLLSSVEHNIDFVLTHPNGWEGQQQGLMRRAAVVAGLIKDGIGQDRLQFVTEGEASLHFCINKNVLTKDQIVRFICSYSCSTANDQTERERYHHRRRRWWNCRPQRICEQDEHGQRFRRNHTY